MVKKKQGPNSKNLTAQENKKVWEIVRQGEKEMEDQNSNSKTINVPVEEGSVSSLEGKAEQVPLAEPSQQASVTLQSNPVQFSSEDQRGAEQLAKILENQEARLKQQEQQIIGLTNAVNSLIHVTEVKAEQAEATQPPAKNQLEALMNGPLGESIQTILKGIMDAITAPEASSVQSTMSDVDLKKMQELESWRDGRLKEMDAKQASWMDKIIEGLDLSNKIKKREMESEF